MGYAEDKAGILKKTDEALENFFRNRKLLKDYLNLESIRADSFEGYSVRDIIAIAYQNPQVTELNTLMEWNDAGKRINKGEKGIVLPDFEPHNPDTNGTRHLYLFDVSQTQGYESDLEKTIQPTKEPSRDEVRALLANNQTRLATTENPERTHGKNVYYDAERNVIIALKGISPLELYHGLAVELAHAEMSMNYSNYTRESHDTLAQMSGYIVCRQNKVSPNKINIDKDLKELSSEEVQSTLELVRSTSSNLQSEINYYKAKGEDRQERYTSQQTNEVKVKIVSEKTKEKNSSDPSINSTVPVEEKVTENIEHSDANLPSTVLSNSKSEENEEVIEVSDTEQKELGSQNIIESEELLENFPSYENSDYLPEPPPETNEYESVEKETIKVSKVTQEKIPLKQDNESKNKYKERSQKARNKKGINATTKTKGYTK